MTITTSTLTGVQQRKLATRMLSVENPKCIHNLGAMRERLPMHSGDTLVFRRPVKLNPALVPLGNSGNTPPATDVSVVDIQARPSLYGAYIAVNEQVVITNDDKPLNYFTQLLGMQLRETEDALTRNMMATSAAFINCTGGVSGDTPTEITFSDASAVVRALMGSDAEFMNSGIEGANKFGTAPTQNSYLALAHTDLSGDLESTAGFKHVSEYPSQNNIPASEWGQLSGLRFQLSSIGSKLVGASTLGNDVYNIFCMGMEALGIVDQDGKSNSMFMPSLNSF
jgi:N4-gp56 family major capsid protein